MVLEPWIVTSTTPTILEVLAGSPMEQDKPIQHLHYLPFGEDWVDQRNSSWNAPYTFSGKEKDVETGYGYFGARYYDSGLSIWLSVDPMSDKYPSMSPYNYCANNPVILVDPDGREVFIDGDMAMQAYNYLASTYSNLNITIDENGKLGATIKTNSKNKNVKLSSDEQQLYNAISDCQVVVNFTAQSIENIDLNGDGSNIITTEFGGAFLGNKLSDDNTFSFTRQVAVIPALEENYDSEDVGKVIGHEITESFEAGIISLNKKTPAQPAISRNGVDIPNPIYDAAHSAAISCPDSKWKKAEDRDRIRQQQIEFQDNRIFK